MPKKRDLTGLQVGRLTVLRPAPAKDVKTWWECRCTCGRVLAIRTGILLQGRQRSCGCIRPRGGQIKHGGFGTPLYAVWQSMKRRCIDAKRPGFDRYGGRGITVCERWLHDFAAFRDDMGPRPPGGTLERIDNDGPYAPENCRWSTRHEQQQNTHRTRRLTIAGHEYTVGEAARVWGIPVPRLRARLNLGWAPERAVSQPSRYHRSS